jgi:hypothetical protein
VCQHPIGRKTLCMSQERPKALRAQGPQRPQGPNAEGPSRVHVPNWPDRAGPNCAGSTKTSKNAPRQVRQGNIRISQFSAPISLSGAIQRPRLTPHGQQQGPHRFLQHQGVYLTWRGQRRQGSTGRGRRRIAAGAFSCGGGPPFGSRKCNISHINPAQKHGFSSRPTDTHLSSWFFPR